MKVLFKLKNSTALKKSSGSSIDNSGNKVTNSPEFSKGQFFKTDEAINRIIHNESFLQQENLRNFQALRYKRCSFR